MGAGDIAGKRRTVPDQPVLIRMVFLMFVLLPAASLCEEQQKGVQYRREVRSEPRPLHIHVLTVDLLEPHLKFHIQLADSPETGEGIAVLTDPYVLAGRGEFEVAINSNPWSMVDGSTNDVKGGAAFRLGWIQLDGVTLSKPGPHANFWIDEDGIPHIGNISTSVEGALIGLEGFWKLIKDGKIVAGTAGGIHPRTAIGFDEEGRRLFLVVADGRMPGYSEGMNTKELALFMEELGCWNALNLDGGGSSIMLMCSEEGGYERKNRAIFGYVRPLPMLFGVQKVQPPESD